MANHTLSDGTTTIDLPNGMIWTDEFNHVNLKTKATPTLDGGQVIEQSIQTKGRPITLEAAEDRGWITRATLQSLQSMAATAEPLVFTHADGTVINVAFAAEPLSARPLWPISNPAPGDYYIATLKLIET